MPIENKRFSPSENIFNLAIADVLWIRSLKFSCFTCKEFILVELQASKGTTVQVFFKH